jgi:hypothetical protein
LVTFWNVTGVGDWGLGVGNRGGNISFLSASHYAEHKAVCSVMSPVSLLDEPHPVRDIAIARQSQFVFAILQAKLVQSRCDADILWYAL